MAQSGGVGGLLRFESGKGGSSQNSVKLWICALDVQSVNPRLNVPVGVPKSSKLMGVSGQDRKIPGLDGDEKLAELNLSSDTKRLGSL